MGLAPYRIDWNSRDNGQAYCRCSRSRCAFTSLTPGAGPKRHIGRSFGFVDAVPTRMPWSARSCKRSFPKWGTDQANAPRFPRARNPGNGVEPDRCHRQNSSCHILLTFLAFPSSRHNGLRPPSVIFYSTFERRYPFLGPTALFIVCITPARSPHREYGGRLI